MGRSARVGGPMVVSAFWRKAKAAASCSGGGGGSSNGSFGCIGDGGGGGGSRRSSGSSPTFTSWHLSLCVGSFLALYSSHNSQSSGSALLPLSPSRFDDLCWCRTGSSPHQTVSDIWLAETKVFRAC